MKTKIQVTILMFVAVFLVNTYSIAGNKIINPKADKGKVEVYYFHFNTRCATCRAIEEETKADIIQLFGSDVSFGAYNLDDKAGEVKGKELGVNSQTLLVVKGDKKLNLTNEGFMYARTNPEKFKKIIEEKIKPLL